MESLDVPQAQILSAALFAQCTMYTAQVQQIPKQMRNKTSTIQINAILRLRHGWCTNTEY